MYTGKDYPSLCRQCQAMVDQCAEEIEVRMSLGDEDMVSGRVRLEFDDDEAPHLLAYDRGLFCGGHECIGGYGPDGSEIDELELMEWWWMSKAFKVRRYDRMLWTSDRYCNGKLNIPSVRAYKALDIILARNEA